MVQQRPQRKKFKTYVGQFAAASSSSCMSKRDDGMGWDLAAAGFVPFSGSLTIPRLKSDISVPATSRPVIHQVINSEISGGQQ